MIIKHIEKWIEAGEKSIITGIAGNEKMTCNHLSTAYNKGDPLARRAISQMVNYLGIWAYNLYVTLNINCFVFGGGLIKMFHELNDSSTGGLVNAMKEVFNKYNKNSMPVYFKEAELSNSMTGDDFGIIGAAELLF